MAINAVQIRVQDAVKEPLIKHGEEFKNKHKGKESIGILIMSTFVASLGSCVFGSCMGYSAPVQAAIREDLDLSLAEFSVFGSLINVSAMIGAITSGKIADFMGRKGAMGLSSVISGIGWIAIYLAQGAAAIDAGRLLCGYGIGIFSYVVPIYIAEIAPKDLRGGLATLNQLFIVIGASVSFIVGITITWRSLALIGTIPCLVQLVGLVFIPESPRWLAKAGYQEEFNEALRRLRGDDVDISQEASDIQDYIVTLQNEPKVRMVDLFQKRYLRSLIIAVGLMAFQQLGGINGFGFYAKETFVSAGSTGNIGIIALGTLQIPITTLGAFLMDKCGRKPLLLISSSGTFLGCFLAAVAFLLKDYNLIQESVSVLVLTGILVHVGSFAIGIGPIPWVIMSEVFPINVKGAAGGLVSLVHWVGAWVLSYSFNFLMDWSSPGTFFIYSGFCAATVIFVVKVVPETKGRTLEDIQASMTS